MKTSNNFFPIAGWGAGMTANYIKIAFRNLWKNKLFSFINIMGLGLAIPFALLALMHLQSTFEFDNFHPHPERIYRVLTNEVTREGTVTKYASSPYLLADELKSNYPSIEKATKVVRDFGWELTTPFKSLKVNTLYVEPSFFEVFGFALAKGSISIAPNTLMLSHEAATRFFNDANPIGQTLVHPTYGPMTVTGVLKPFKKQTQFRSDVMVSIATLEKFRPEIKQNTGWGTYETHTFVRVQPNTPASALDLALQGVAKKTNVNLTAVKKTNLFRKQVLADISPSVEDLRYNPYVDSMEDIYFNFFIPLMILLLAGFNYTNLTLARSLSRAKEVGVRKVMGAIRLQLVIQFICEALIIAFFAFGIGLVLLYFMKQNLQVQWLTWEVENKALIGGMFVIFTLVLGIVAGALPAIILSKFQPAMVLKGILGPVSFGKVNFRKSLIVIQFIATLGFLFMIGHMYNQFSYMATENDNFNRKGIFNLSLAGQDYRVLIDDIKKHKDVEKIGLVSMPFGGVPSQQAIKVHEKDENSSTYYYSVDKNFIENMNLTLVAGKNLPFSSTDSASHFILLNETAVQRLRLGTPREAIGQQVFLNNAFPAQIVGIVKDFCHFHYQYKKEPLVFQYNPSQFAMMSVKVNPQVNQDAFLADMKVIWKKYNPYKELGYSWYEKELYDRYYPAEDMKIMGLTSLIIFVIALMGLLGMVTYSTEKRYKEIGIRKVMGASVWEVVRILSWSFLKLLFIAAVVALPIGLVENMFMNKMFTFYAGLNIGLMIMFFGVVLSVAVGAIAYYATKAALVNPAKSLKSE